VAVRRRIPRHAEAVLSASLVIAIAACGGSTPPPSSTAGAGAASRAGDAPTSIDSCAILSDEELKAATGQGVIERSPSTLTQVFSSVCDIDLDNAGKLTVSVLASGGRGMYERSFEPLIGQGDVLDEAVSGLGDKAARAGNNELMVLVDDVLFDILYIGFGREDKLAAVRYLADAVVAKLPCIAAGCPGMTAAPPPPTDAAQAIDVCALLTEDEIKQATGTPVAKTEQTESLSCTWSLDSGSFVGNHFVRLRLLPSGGREQFDFLANEMFDTPPEHVPGLGDDAIKMASIPDGSIHALVGDRLLSLEFTMPLDMDDPYALLVPLLKAAVGRL
jgi:hypothetical protein